MQNPKRNSVSRIFEAGNSASFHFFLTKGKEENIVIFWLDWYFATSKRGISQRRNGGRKTLTTVLAAHRRYEHEGNHVLGHGVIVLYPG